jgi:hypothetical protein
MRQAAARYNLLVIHIEGRKDDHVPPCAKCAAKNEHPNRRTLSYCRTGNAIRNDFWKAYAEAWYLVAECRTRQGLPPRAVAGEFSLDVMKAELQFFYDWEFQLPDRPRGLKRQPANMFRIDEIIIGKTPNTSRHGRVPTGRH